MSDIVIMSASPTRIHKMIKLTLSELKYLDSAASTDLHTERLKGVAFSNHKGKAYACATDTHRLHVVELGDAFPALPDADSGDAIRLDVASIIKAMSDCKANEIELDLSNYGENCFVVVKMYSKRGGYHGQIELPSLDGRYPLWYRVVPEGNYPASQFYAFNPRYLRDAISLVPQGGAVIMLQQSPSKPLMIRSRPGDEGKSWYSVFMPHVLDASASKCESVFGV